MKPGSRSVVVALVVGAGAGIVGCGAQTSTTHVWQAQAQPPRLATDVLVFGGRMPEATRRTVEDALARELAERGTRATPSYRIFPQLPQRDIAQAEVKRLGYGGAVVATLRQIRERQSRTRRRATSAARRRSSRAASTATASGRASRTCRSRAAT